MHYSDFIINLSFSIVYDNNYLHLILTMDQLLNLIRSLSSKEKSQFVKYARQHLGKREAQKVTLFNLVAKQIRGQLKDYQKQALKTIRASTLPSLKTRLYNQVLASLTTNSVRSYRREVSQMIDEIQILIDRGLLRQALSRIEKVKALADRNHLHFQYLEVSLLYRSIIRQYKTRDVENLLTKEQSACEKRIEWIAEEFGLLKTYEPYFLKQRVGQLPAGSFSDLDITGENPPEIESFEGKLYSHLLMQMKYNFEKKYADALQESKKLLELFEQNPSMKTEKLPRYLRAVTNYLNACFRIGNYEEAKTKIEEVKKFRPTSFYAEAQKESILLSQEVILYFQQKQFQHIANMAPRAHAVFRKYQTFISFERTLGIYYNMGVSFFLLGRLNEALDWLNSCLNEKDFSEMNEKATGKTFGILVQGSAMVFRIIVFYEKGNTRLARNLLPTAFYYFEQRGLTRSVLFQILNTLNSILKNKTEEKDQLILLRELLADHPQYEEYSLWVNQTLLKAI